MNKKTQDMTRKMTMIKKTLLMVLMLTFGMNVSWGQTEPIGYNYSGTYFIANANYSDDATLTGSDYSPTVKTGNFYLCPASNYYDGDKTDDLKKMPFLTTHQPDDDGTGRPSIFTDPIAKWEIVFAEPDEETQKDYYYIKFVSSESTKYYLVHNEQIVSGTGTNPGRVRYHLQLSIDGVDKDDYLFYISPNTRTTDKNYNICSKAEESRTPSASRPNGASLNPAKANLNFYTGQTQNSPGSFQRNVDKARVYCGGLIGHWDLHDKTGLWYFEDVKCKTPGINYVYDDTNNELTLTLASETESFVYYTEGTGLVVPDDPTTSDNLYESELTITGTTTIKAMTHKNYMEDSEPIMKKIVLNPIINLTIPEGGYTYDGTAKQPTVTSIMVGETTIEADDYEVSYSDNTNAGIGTAKVNITAKAGSDYIVYGSTTFTINKADITPSVSVDGWSYGDTSTPVITGNSGEGTVTCEYKERGAEDETYTTTVPTAVGNYTVRATIAETTNYNAGSATADFSITKKSLGDGADPALGISIDVTKVGTTYTVTVKQGGSTTLTEGDYTETGNAIANGKYYITTVTVMVRQKAMVISLCLTA